MHNEYLQDSKESNKDTKDYNLSTESLSLPRRMTTLFTPEIHTSPFKNTGSSFNKKDFNQTVTSNFQKEIKTRALLNTNSTFEDERNKELKFNYITLEEFHSTERENKKKGKKNKNKNINNIKDYNNDLMINKKASTSNSV